MEITLLHIFGIGGVLVSTYFALRAFPEQIKTMCKAESVEGLNPEQYIMNVFAQICAVGLGLCLHSWYIWVPSIVIGIESVIITVLYFYYRFYFPRRASVA